MASRSDLDVYINGHDNLSPSLDRQLSSIIRWVGAVSSALAALEVAAFPVKSIREFEREMANVQKTTGFTRSEIDRLGNSLRQMSTRIDVSAADLAKIAAAAGQQGLGREGVEGIVAFTDSVARMSSVLDISVDEAGAAVGKLASIFKVPLTEVENLVSAFNEVANNSTATGDQLIDVVRRVGDAAGAFNSYADTLGIGAAAIDFGVSPEVAGTSLTKIFADMQSKAEKFSEFMQMSVADWMGAIERDGIDAFKMYLDRLRQMDAASRQAAIRDLSGTGRIGALLNKFVNDTTNTILERNLASAYRGLETGTSAMREQATVLKTLDAQIKITQNAFRNLGIAAGEQFSGALASNMARLTEAFEDPAVVSFARAVGDAFLGIIRLAADLISAIASLNVNWENLIPLVTALVAIKTAEWTVSLIARLTGLNKILQSTATQAAGAAAGISQIGKAANSVPENTFRGQRDALRKLAEERENVRKAIEAQQRAERNLAAAEAAHAAARQRQDNLYSARQTGLQALRPQDANVAQATALAASRQAAIGVAVQNAQAAMNARLERAETEHQQRMSQIESEYQTRRLAAKQANNQQEIRQLRAWRLEQLAAEEASYQRSLRSINAYHTRRIASVRAAATQEAAAAAAGVAAAQANRSRAANALGIAAQDAALRAAEATTERLKRQADEARDNLNRASAAATAASATFSRAANVIATLRIGVTMFFRALSFVTTWGFLLFTLADLLGLLDKLGPGFHRFAAALGLATEKQREDNQAREKTIEQLKEEQRLRAAMEKYRNLVDPTTGELDERQVAALPTLLRGENRDAASRALDEITTVVEAATQIIESNREKLSLLPVNRERAQQQLAEIENLYRQSVERMERLQAELTPDQLNQINNPDQFTGAARAITPLMRQFVTAKREADELAKSVEAARKELDKAGAAAESGITNEISKAQRNLEKLGPVIAGLFTDQSAKVFTEYADKLADLQEQLNKTNAARAESEQALVASQEKGQEAIDAQTAKLSEQDTELARIRDEQQKLWEQINAEIEYLKNAPGVNQTLLNSLEALRDYLKLNPEDLRTLRSALDMLAAAGTPLTGANAPTPAPRSTGDDSYSGGSGAGAARRESKARLKVLQEEREAEARLEKEANAERLKQLEYTNDQGMIAIRDFYNQKQAIQLQDNARAIALAQAELEGVRQEYNTAKDNVSKLQAQASMIRVQGEIAALEQQRQFIQNQIGREQQDALREFEERLAQERTQLMQFLGTGSDEQFFQESLRTYEASYREFLNRLEAESEDMPELLPVIDNIRLQMQLQAAGDAINRMQERIDLMGGAADREARRLELMAQRGVISTFALEKAVDDLRERQIEQQRVELEGMQNRLALLPQGSLEYERLAERVDEARLRMEELKATSDATAIGINQGISGSLATALADFTGTMDSLRSVASSFALDVAQQIQSVLAKGVAEGIMSRLSGETGAGGIGGFIDKIMSGALGLFGGGGQSDDKAITGAAAQATKTATDTIAKAGVQVTEALVDSSDTMSTDILGTFGNLFSKLGSGLSSIFSSLFNSLGSGGGGLFGFIANLFHSGGTVGAGGGMRRRVNPALFLNAARYHNGSAGVGLKPDEVPAILRKGETVRTPEQEAALARNGANGANGKATNIWIVTPDQQVGMTPEDVIVTVADNIQRGGSIKKLIKTVR